MASKVKILLVEDDKKFAESLVKLFAQEGYECHWADKPQAALSLIKLHNFDAALIDCLLPQMNGVDLAVKIKDATPMPIAIYLMSGVYKDRNFSINAIKKTQAKSFFIKPFEISTFIQEINGEFASKKIESQQEAATTVKSFISLENLTQNSIIKTLMEQKDIAGIELSMVMNLLIFYKYKGVLNIKSTDGEFNLGFNEGQLSLQDSEISPAQVRANLIHEKAIADEDLSEISDRDFTESYLIKNNYISPHIFKHVKQSVAIRKLNTLMDSAKVTLDLSNSPMEGHFSLSAHETDEFLYKWSTTSDIRPIKEYYKDFMFYAFRKLNTQQNKTFQLPIIAAHKAVINCFLEGKTFQEILMNNLCSEELLLRIMHILLINREFAINLKTKQNTKAHIEKLKSLQASMARQNFFARLGLPENANDSDVKKAFLNLSQNFHPDKLQNEPDEIRQNSQVIYELIQEAYRGLKSLDDREAYSVVLAQQKLANVSKADSLLDQVIVSLMKSDYMAAESQLNEVEGLDSQSNKFKMVQIWLLAKNRKQPTMTLNRILQTISNDEKESALYYYVRGLIHTANFETDKAAIAFKNCLTKDNNFLPARRDLGALNIDDKKASKSFLKADIKDVVGLFFKKRS